MSCKDRAPVAASTSWTEIVVAAGTGDLWKVEAALHMETPLGLYIEDYSDLEDGVRRISGIDLIEDELLQRDRGTALAHVYFPPDANPAERAEAVRVRLAAAGLRIVATGNVTTGAVCEGSVSVGVGSVREEDWANNWKQYFKPLRVGKSILIRPRWLSLEAAGSRCFKVGDAPAEIFDDINAVVSIDPGMAFGTGGHVTTRLCLELIETYFENHVTDVDVLDVGAGSGILSVAALLLGARSALGVDIDAYAARNARENAELNGVGERARYTVGDLTSGVWGRYALVLANIVADVVISLLADAGRLLAPGGAIICSGIIAEREADVLEAARARGFAADAVLRADGWVAMRLRAGT